MLWRGDAHRAPGTGCVAGRSVHGRGRGLGAQWALVWLVLALVIAPTLGRLHQVGHAQVLQQVHAGHQATGLHDAPGGIAHAAGSPAQAHSPALDLVSHLLGSHGAADCLLLDQLALGDALTGALVPFTAPPPAQATGLHRAIRHTAPHVALFQARGPPTAV